MANDPPKRPGSYSHVARELSSLHPPRRQTSTTTISQAPERSQRRRAAWWGGGSIGVLGLILGLWQGIPWDLLTSSPPEHPVTADELEALRKRLDEVQSRQQRMRRRLRRQGEAICDANQGPPMVDWPCPDDHEYRTPRNPPPLRRSNRVYPE